MPRSEVRFHLRDVAFTEAALHDYLTLRDTMDLGNESIRSSEISKYIRSRIEISCNIFFSFLSGVRNGIGFEILK
jgi:hypothetical protein